jgi:peptidoglycan/xylan/chitin deacetylase (PgdA/CDA1 family)
MREAEPERRGAVVRAILHVMRVLGVFSFAQLLTRQRLRILGYHGIAVGDQYQFSPFLFMRESTFRRRLEILRRRRMNVVPLGVALKNLQAGSNRAVEAVITIDDGWWSTLAFAAPLLNRCGYQATLYLSTRHAVEGTPVATVALSYMFWKRKETRLVLSGVDPSVDGTYELTSYDHAAEAVLEQKITQLDSAAQARMLQQVADNLNLDASQLPADKRFHLITLSDIETLARMGVDTQLHTHDHVVPENLSEFTEQLEQNRRHIRIYSRGEPLHHFCYPSGRYSARHAQWLTQLDVLSATTCDPGLNSRTQDPYALRRFLDSESISEIEFEAQISGVFELAKLVRSAIVRVVGRSRLQ